MVRKDFGGWIRPFGTSTSREGSTEARKEMTMTLSWALGLGPSLVVKDERKSGRSHEVAREQDEQDRLLLANAM